MGAVYVAHDRQTGERVALKVLLEARDSQQRFLQETRLLASLHHPAIVRHIAHGPSPHGPFLAMAWLKGEDLRARSRREPLSLEETLALMHRTTEALSAAHRAGVIHRDIKPSNLFLVDGDPTKLQLIDFGVARPKEDAPALTRTGVLVGTLGYMSPEQARGRRAIDERADLFSLGSVFYECLTGRAAFTGHNAVAVLAAVMMTDPPPVRSVRPEIPRAVEDLVTRLLAKDPAERPANAESVLVALESLGHPTAPAPSLATSGAVRLTDSERRLRTVVLLELGRRGSATAPTPEELDEEERTLERIVSPFGAQIAPVAAGSYVVLTRIEGPATDQAARAGSCAIAIAEAFPEARIAVTTGRTVATDQGSAPTGPSVASAAEMLVRNDSPAVRIDAVTAGLLGPRFEVEGNELRGHAPGLPGVRKLLGRDTPCVGRRKELRLLRDTMEECLEERCVQSVLITAPAGAGKSRLRHELVRGVDRDQWLVLEASAESVGAGSPGS